MAVAVPVARDLYAEAESRLGRRLTPGERRRDVAAIDQALEHGKDTLRKAIEDEKRAVIRGAATAFLHGRVIRPQLRVTNQMIHALIVLYDHGRFHAKKELAAIGLETAKSFAVRDIPPLDPIMGRLQSHLGSISLRVDAEATFNDLSGLSLAAMVREIDRAVPGALDAASRLVSGAFDTGLGEVFGTSNDLVEAWVYSAMMDANTCDECAAEDGHEFESWDAISVVLPNGGPNPNCFGDGRCRCMAVPSDAAKNPTGAAGDPMPLDLPDVGEVAPTLFTGGRIDAIAVTAERYELTRLEADMETSPVFDAWYSQTYGRLEQEIESAQWASSSAKMEAYEAITRVGVDDVRVLRDDEGRMLGVVSMHPRVNVSEMEQTIREIRGDIEAGFLSAAEGEQMIQAAQAMITRELGRKVVGVNHLASTGAQKGTGARLMREVAREAERDGTGVGLNSLQDAKGFYERLGMHSDILDRPNDLFWTREEAAQYARDGFIGRSPPPAPAPVAPRVVGRPFEHYKDSTLTTQIGRRRKVVADLKRQIEEARQLGNEARAARLETELGPAEERVRLLLEEKAFRTGKRPTPEPRPRPEPPAPEPVPPTPPAPPVEPLPPVSRPFGHYQDSTLTTQIGRSRRAVSHLRANISEALDRGDTAMVERIRRELVTANERLRQLEEEKRLRGMRVVPRPAPTPKTPRAPKQPKLVIGKKLAMRRIAGRWSAQRIADEIESLTIRGELDHETERRMLDALRGPLSGERAPVAIIARTGSSEGYTLQGITSYRLDLGGEMVTVDRLVGLRPGAETQLLREIVHGNRRMTVLRIEDEGADVALLERLGFQRDPLGGWNLRDFDTLMNRQKVEPSAPRLPTDPRPARDYFHSVPKQSRAQGGKNAIDQLNASMSLLDKLFPGGFAKDARKINLKLGSGRGNTWGSYTHGSNINNNTVAISRSGKASPIETFMHEFGHYVDNLHIPDKSGTYASEGAPLGRFTHPRDGKPTAGPSAGPLEDWWNAILRSQAYEKVQEARAGRGGWAASSRSHADYLSTGREFFARSFAQYVITVARDEIARNPARFTQLERDTIDAAWKAMMYRVDEYGSHWSTPDFAPIFDAFTEMFRHYGWSVTA